MKFPDLVTHIAEVDDMARISAGRFVQQALSFRNWIIGAGIVEFEQSGDDRAAYGDRLLTRLSNALNSSGCKGLSARNLKNFRQVALAYAGLDGFGLGRRLGLFPVTQPGEIRQTSAESVASLFPSLTQRAAMTEGTLEQALLDHLQHFMLELGREFCFMGRQFRITIGNRHHYLDLLFFHRRLRCLVAIDLKLGEFLPEHAGQLRFYVNYLAEHVAHPDENPPVGILLCAERDAEVVRFATAGSDDVFVTQAETFRGGGNL